MTNPTLISQMVRMPSFAPIKNEQVQSSKCGNHGQPEAPEGQSEEMQGLLKQLGSMIQANMMMTMMRLNQTMSSMGGMGGMGGMMGGMGAMGGLGGMAAMQQLNQLSMLQNMLQQVQDMQAGNEEPPPAYGDIGDPPPDYKPHGGGKPECGKPGPTTTEATKPTEPQVSADQAKINDDKMKGIGNHPLGPDDDLLPPGEKNMSVSDLKNIKNEDGKQKYGLIANLGNQEGMRDKLKSVVGDIDNDPKAMARGEAYLQKIKHMPNPDGSKRPDDIVNNGKLEGCTGSGDIRSGTEAAILKDSFKGGPQVSDKDAPNPIDKNKAYGWLNEQKALAPTNDKHVVNGGSFKGDAQVFFENVGENIKKGFEKIGEGFKKIGEGIKNFAEGAIKAIGGAFKVVGGALTFNPDLIKDGANNVKDGAKGAWNAVDTGIKGVGEVLGGAAGAAVAISPAGMAINQMTGNAASRLATGTFEGIADTVVKGRNGLINAADAAIHGDFKGVAKGLYDTANLAMMFVPGAGQANMARNIAQNAGKELIKDGIKGSVKDEAMLQYKENKNEGTQQA